MSSIVLRSPGEIEAMRAACQLAARTVVEAGKLVRPGLSTLEINEFVHAYTLQHKAVPVPLNYRGFPMSVCTSINEVICHGIPSNRRLVEGDIVNIDVTSILDGWYGDVSATFYVGAVAPHARRLTEVTRECLARGIAVVRPDARIGDIGAAIQEHAEANGFSVVRDFVGHGLGRRFHEPPQVPHFGERGRGVRLRTGMTFTIEPMINEGRWPMRVLDDGWTAVTADGKLSAQFEHTVAVTADGVDVLTAFPEPLVNSEI